MRERARVRHKRHIHAGSKFAIQPALIYNVKGSTFGAAIEGSEAFNADFKTGFLELPVQVQLGFGIGSIARVYGFAEPFIGYAITNQVDGWPSEIGDQWEFVKSRLEYGVGLGAGVELFRHLQVSVKYFWNLGDLYNADLSFGSISKELLSTKCSGIAASVAFLF